VINKREIVERTAKQHRNWWVYTELAKQAHLRDVENTLTTAGYFDLLEAARELVVQNMYEHVGWGYCNECHQQWSEHKNTCSTGALVELLRKAGVRVE